MRRAFAMLVLLLAWGLICPPASASESRPRRIVSLNLCLDPLVLALVPRERIAALSFVAADPLLSPIANDLAGIRVVKGGAEEVLALDADLVLAGAYSTPATVSLLQRLGRRVEVVPIESDLTAVRAAVRQVAAAVGEPQRGEEMIAAFDRQLAAAAPPASVGRRPTAAVYQLNGVISGPGTLIDEALRAAGFANHAESLPLGPAGRVGLEALVAKPPDLVVLGQEASSYRTVGADNLRHPALAALVRQRPHLLLPMQLWLCGTPHVAEAVTLLAAARAQLRTRSLP
jgi:iron complex transport system substrate-binding protein